MRLNNESSEKRIQQFDEIKAKESSITSETTESVQNNAGPVADPGRRRQHRWDAGDRRVGPGVAGQHHQHRKDRDQERAVSQQGRRGQDQPRRRRNCLCRNDLHPAELVRPADQIVRAGGCGGGNVGTEGTRSRPSRQRIESGKARVKEMVGSLLGIADAAAVTVRSYVDLLPDMRHPR